METMFALFCIFVAFFAGFGACIVWQLQVKRVALSIVRDQAGEKGRKAKIEQEGELMALITDASAQFKQAKDSGENLQVAAARIIPQLIAKYPTTVMKHGKKLLKSVTEGGGLEALEDFL